jgi:uncharacterized membrane protein
MRKRVRRAAIGILALAGTVATVASGVPAAAASAESPYEHISLLPDTGQGEALGVNDVGEAVGDVLVAGQPHAAVWKHGRLHLIRTGLVRSAAMSVNDAGLVVGQGLDTSGRRHGWAWWGSGPVFMLRSPFPGSTDVQVRHVNQADEVVGTASDTAGTPHAVVWRRPAGAPHVLAATSGSAGSLGSGLNDAGAASGASVLASGASDIPTLWGPGGRPGRLPTIGGPADVWALSDLGLAVGSGFTSRGLRSNFLAWRHGHVRNVGTLPGDDDAAPNAINDWNLAVGYSASDLTPKDSGNTRAVFWRPGQPALRLLPELPGTTFATAHDVNDHGVIVGLAADPHGSIHPVVWRP